MTRSTAYPQMGDMQLQGDTHIIKAGSRAFSLTAREENGLPLTACTKAGAHWRYAAKYATSTTGSTITSDSPGSGDKSQSDGASRPGNAAAPGPATIGREKGNKMNITNEQFDAKLTEILDGMTGAQILSIPRHRVFSMKLCLNSAK